MSRTSRRYQVSVILPVVSILLNCLQIPCSAEDAAMAEIEKNQATIKQMETQMVQLMAQGKNKEAAEVKAKVSVLLEKNNQAIKARFDSIKSKLDELNKQNSIDSKALLPGFQKALANVEIRYGKNSAEAAEQLENVGGAQFDIGDVQKGEASFDRAIRIYDGLPQTAETKRKKAELIDTYKLYLKNAYVKVNGDASRAAEKAQLQKKMNELQQK